MGNTIVNLQNTIRLFSVSALVGLSACNTHAGDPFYHAWYNVYGQSCGNTDPKPGCEYYQDGTKIIAAADSDYMSYYYLTYQQWNYTDVYGNAKSFTGYGWLSNSGILYDQNGVALNESDSSENTSADVLAIAAAMEKKTLTAAGKLLSQKYALAEDKGIEISKTLNAWAVLGRDRMRTQADTDDFTKRLYGIDPTKAKEAILSSAAMQDLGPLEGINVDIAAYWGTTPEVSKKILKSWYQNELPEYGAY